MESPEVVVDPPEVGQVAVAQPTNRRVRRRGRYMRPRRRQRPRRPIQNLYLAEIRDPRRRGDRLLVGTYDCRFEAAHDCHCATLDVGGFPTVHVFPSDEAANAFAVTRRLVDYESTDITFAPPPSLNSYLTPRSTRIVAMPPISWKFRPWDD